MRVKELMSMKVDSPIGPQPQQLAEFARWGACQPFEDAVLPVGRVARQVGQPAAAGPAS